MSGDSLWVGLFMGVIALLLCINALVSIHAWIHALLYGSGRRFSLRHLLLFITLVAIGVAAVNWLAS